MLHLRYHFLEECMFKLKKKVHIEEFEIILYFFNNSLFIKHKKIKILNIFSSFIQYFIYLNEKKEL